MADWIKILLSAVVGFTFAMISEPLRTRLSHRFRMKTLRRALYVELFYNLDGLYDLEELRTSGQVPTSAVLESMFSRKALAYAESQPELFYQMPDYRTLTVATSTICTFVDCYEARARGRVGRLEDGSGWNHRDVH